MEWQVHSNDTGGYYNVSLVSVLIYCVTLLFYVFIVTNLSGFFSHVFFLCFSDVWATLPWSLLFSTQTGDCNRRLTLNPFLPWPSYSMVLHHFLHYFSMDESILFCIIYGMISINCVTIPAVSLLSNLFCHLLLMWDTYGCGGDLLDSPTLICCPAEVLTVPSAHSALVI